MSTRYSSLTVSSEFQGVTEYFTFGESVVSHFIQMSSHWFRISLTAVRLGSRISIAPSGKTMRQFAAEHCNQLIALFTVRVNTDCHTECASPRFG